MKMFRKKGFTLMELIIVIIIIGLLISVGLPQYRRMIERGQVGRALGVIDMMRKAEGIIGASTNQYTAVGNAAVAPNALDNEVDGIATAATRLVGQWTFSAAGGALNAPGAGRVTALRAAGGMCAGSFSYDQNGAITGVGAFAPGAACANYLPR